MSANCFYMLCGLPGSGKSYWAREKAKPYDVIVSSDSIREELYGDASVQDNPACIFNIMFQRTRAALNAGRTVFYDATNLSSRYRINLLKSLKKQFPNVEYRCVVMATPVDVCYDRNSKRERIVPEYVIGRMLRQFEVPCDGEGWDFIDVEYAPEAKLYRRVYSNLVEAYGNQRNSHHTLTLSKHCEACGDAAKANNALPDIVQAAYLHDYGKIWTATTWEKDNYKEVHYPNHANVASYLTLTMGYPLRVAQLVGYHMIPIH